MAKKIWLVEHPTYQYKEDVRSLALANGLTVVDKLFSGNFTKEQLADKPPKLTKKTAKSKKED
jgi:hypothetical protein